MRRAALAVVFALGASRAWAQPAPAEEVPEAEKPKEEPPAPPVAGKGSGEEPTGAQIARPVKSTPADTTETPLTISGPQNRGFRFGSYGRVLAGSDLRGGKPEKVAIVAHAPRVVEDSYLELEMSYGFVTEKGLELRPVITLAFDGTLFHDTGEFDAHPALRNLFLDAQITKNLAAWVGSRMYRGDDIYLFDYWPLDDQNTVGGGLLYRQNEVELGTHVGFNRLNHPFQFQEIDVPNPVQGATTVEQLNRQRIVASATAAYFVRDIADDLSAKAKVHAEVHSLAAGTRKRMDGTLEALPADSGLLVGGEVGVFGTSPRSKDLRRHLNLFLRYAKGLAAFDELAPPTSFGPELKTQGANELTFGLSLNVDHALGNILIGALSRRFIDADESSTDPDDGWEYAIDARPLARIVPDWFVGADVSYQARFPKGLNAITLRAEDASVFQIAPMIAFSPMGPSAYDRPQLRVFYRAAHLDSGALDLYVPDDPRHGHDWVHFIGFAAEWWFNSSTYR